jgi:hypothetical protein
MSVNLNVTELDFDLIRNNIKSHLRNQSKYNDYDFEGSGLSILLDILAYNTHYNAMAAHFALNEAFLDSAQIRGNVVSHAKLLGYTPRSTSAPTAYVNISVNVENIPGGPTIPPALTLERGAKLVSVIDGEEYGFVVIESLTVLYDFTNERFFFENVPIKQGTFKTMSFRIDEYIPNQKFEIPDEDVDMTTLRVRVRSNEFTSNYEIYTPFTTLSSVGRDSRVYFYQENSNAKYEIYFGDNVIGFKPTSDNIVELQYVYTAAEDANGARTFTMASEIGGYSDIDVTTVSSSAGGASRENIESVRFNAPLSYITQNRAVTADDYRAIIVKEYGDIDAISVWGGEDANPPDYGKVFVSIKPKTAEVLTAREKDFILNNILKQKNVVSITPIMVDPAYTYIKLVTFFKYNPNLTDRTAAELQSLATNVISDYNDTNLKKFDGVFRYSQLLRNIDNADPAILNSYVRVFMFKVLNPSNTELNYYDLEFAAPIYTTSSDESVMSSTGFFMNGVIHYFADTKIEGSTNRRIYMYKYVNSILTIVNLNAGTIYTTEGRVVINSFLPDTIDPITISFTPNSNDLAPRRNQLLSIDMTRVTCTGEIDSIAVAGSAGAVNYKTTSRH